MFLCCPGIGSFFLEISCLLIWSSTLRYATPTKKSQVTYHTLPTMFKLARQAPPIDHSHHPPSIIVSPEYHTSLAHAHKDNMTQCVKAAKAKAPLAENAGDMSVTCRQRVKMSPILDQHACWRQHKNNCDTRFLCQGFPKFTPDAATAVATTAVMRAVTAASAAAAALATVVAVRRAVAAMAVVVAVAVMRTTEAKRRVQITIN
jgi:hypothetical protein